MANIPLSQDDLQYIEHATINAEDDLEGQDDGGSLNPELQEDFFIRVRNQMRMNRHARIVPMVGNGIEIPRLNITGRTMERDRFQASRKRSIDTDEIALNGKRIKSAFRVTRGFLEQNVERERVLDTLVDVFSRKFANGCELLLWLSNKIGHAIKQSEYNNDRDDIGSTTQYILDDLYNMFDGMIKQAIALGNVVNAAGSTNLRLLITQALKSLPSEYREDISVLRIFMPLAIEDNLRYILGERRTPLGDIALTSSGEITICGIRVVGIPLLSNNPLYVQNITFGNTSTDVALSFAGIDQDDVIVTPTTLSSSPVTADALTTDYTVNETNGTLRAVGSTTPNRPSKVTYKVPPLFILTLADNIIVGLNQDFRIGQEYDLDTDTTLVVIRSRIDFVYQEAEAVVLVKNVQDALPGAAPL